MSNQINNARDDVRIRRKPARRELRRNNVGRQVARGIRETERKFGPDVNVNGMTAGVRATMTKASTGLVR